jgi:phage terminase large subunit GpA-like protein
MRFIAIRLAVLTSACKSAGEMPLNRSRICKPADRSQAHVDRGESEVVLFQEESIYAWARKYGGARAVFIKGDSRGAAPISAPSPIEVGPQGNRVRWGIRVWPVNGSMIKEELYRWLRLDRPTDESGEPYPPGYCHFPKYSEEYFKQITAEQLVTRAVKGYRRPEWQKTRDRNDALNARVYARAAAAVYGMDRFNNMVWQTLEDRLAAASRQLGQPPQPPQPAGPPQRPTHRGFLVDRSGGGFR